MARWFKRLVATSAAVAAVSVLSGATAAQAAFPERPVRLVVMYSPGGASDVVARILAQHMEAALGQSVVVQNVAGGGGAVGWQQAKDARPDGYTLTLFVDSLPVMEATKAIDFTQDDFEPIVVWGDMSLTVFTRADGPYQSLEDLKAAAAERPGQVGLAIGYGTPSQFVGKIVADSLGVDLNLVNVGGGAEKKTAVLGGHVDAGIEPIPGMAEPYRAGQFDILAVLAEERLESFPDIPTAREQGADAVAFNTYGLLAPKGTPEDRLEVIEQAVAKVAADPEFIEANRRVNFDVKFMPRDETRDYIERVRERMLGIGRSLGF